MTITPPSRLARVLTVLRNSITGRRALIVLGALAVGFAVVAPGALTDRNQKFSSYDESTHLDNAWRWSHFDAPQKGERISPEILSEWTCRGFYDSKVNFPECTGVEEISDATFPISLSNYNTKHPPIYYVVNGFIGRAIVSFTPVDSFVSAVRLANAVWAALVLVVATTIFRQLKLSRTAAAVLGLLAVLIPVAFWRWTYANNDVASYASGWLIAASALRAKRIGLRAGLAWLTCTAVFGALTKGFTIGAVIAATIVLFPTVWRTEKGEQSSPRRPGLGSLIQLAVPGASAAAAVVGWLGFHAIYKSNIPYAAPFIREPPDGTPWARISEEVIRIAAPIGGLPGWIFSSTGFLSTAYFRWSELLAWLLSISATALVIGLSAERLHNPHRSVGLATLLTPPLLATIVISYNLLDGSPVFIKVIDRYHISVLPFFVISLALVMAARPAAARIATWFVSIGLVIHAALYLTAVT